MRTSFILFISLYGIGPVLGQVGTAVEVNGQLLVNLGVPMDKQIDYIRELSRFYFSKVRWYRKFRANACPEFESIVKDTNSFCPLGTMPPLQPIYPFNRCDVNPDLPNCSITTGTGPDGKPTCQEVPERCSPPLYCDWQDNRNKAECLPRPDCAANPTSVLCKTVTKCDLPMYAGAQACIDKRTCTATDTLVCLDICDTPNGVNKNECIVEKCNIFPNEPICTEVRKCMPKPVCDAVTSITDPACCAGGICIVDCKTRGDCPPPPKVCQWGYNLGNAVIKMFEDPVERKIVDTAGVLSFIDCYTDVTQNIETKLEMKCFESGVTDGFIALDEATKQSLIAMTQQYQNVTVVNNTNQITYTMKNSTTQRLTAQ